MFDDYEDYRLSHGEEDDSGNHSGDGCLYIVLIGIMFVIIQSFF